MMLSHVTLRDPELLHQVVLARSHSNGPVQVSCNCLATGHGRNGHGEGHAPMGPAPDLDAARVLYNDPALHREPFDLDRDGAKW